MTHSASDVERAKLLLSQANAGRENRNDWPAGQEWDELAPSSQQTFLRLAREDTSLALTGPPALPFIS